MPQVINGLSLGAVGLPTAAPVYIFRALGDPANSTDPNVSEASIGSLYLRIDGGAGTTLYVLEPGGWVGK
jgi:hypothetical protein